MYVIFVDHGGFLFAEPVDFPKNITRLLYIFSDMALSTLVLFANLNISGYMKFDIFIVFILGKSQILDYFECCRVTQNTLLRSKLKIWKRSLEYLALVDFWPALEKQ